jgi:hypothetical protein
MEPISSTKTQIEVEVPTGATVWQIKCTDCASDYGIIQAEAGDRHPIFCAYCCHRTTPIKVDTNGRI